MPNYGNSNLKVSDAITVAEVSGTPDAYPTHFAFLGKGGWRSAATLDILNSTSAARKEEGGAGYVWNDGNNNGLYVWNGTSWVKTSLSPTAYTLPIAAASTLGGVRIPSSGPISINNSNGDLSLRVATTSATGIVRVGSGLAVDGDGILSVTSADLTVRNSDASYEQSYPNLRFTGSGIAGISENQPDDETVVEINLPTATDGTTAGAFSNIVFNASGGISATGTYNSGTKTYTITYAITSSGTLKQNLHELDDVDQSTVQFPTGGYILQYDGDSSKWIAVDYTPGIALTSLSASAPIIYNNSTGAFTMNVANTGQNGYLTSTDWNTFNGKQNALTAPNSVKISSNTIELDGDSATPGNNKVYGTNGSGVKGWQNAGSGGITSINSLTNSAQTIVIGTGGTDVGISSSSSIHTINIPTAASDKRGVITGGMYDSIMDVGNKLNITAATNSGTGGNITLDFANADTIYGTVASPVTALSIGVSTASGKVGVTHIVVHNSSTAPTISGALKLSGSGNYKTGVNNYIYFTYISGTTVIYSINQT
jgi:hypothetical protein